MAFPQVAATNHSVEADRTTSHTVSLPANISAGDLLIVFFVTDGNPTHTWPEGWTEILGIPAKYNYARLSVAWKKAVGDEGASITVTTSASETSSHISYRITGHIDPVTQAPEASTGATGSGTTPDPDSLTPTGGAKDYLWLAVEGNDDARLCTDYPANYTNGETYYSGLESGPCAIGIARWELNASSEDPGAFTITAYDYWAACTVAVHPEEEAAYYHGLKVQGVGELALCDVGSHPLRIRKGGTTYGIELVATDDPNASKIRMKTGAGIKAIRKYT